MEISVGRDACEVKASEIELTDVLRSHVRSIYGRVSPMDAIQGESTVSTRFSGRNLGRLPR
jgi:hypothetical protein